MGDSYESFYNQGFSTIGADYGAMGDEPSKGFFTGYRMNAHQLGFPGSVQSANQLGESINAIKQGVTAFEVTMGVADTAEQIPIQHFEEMRALMKLTGVRPSVHAPFDMDPAGFVQNTYDEDHRKDNERRFFETLKKAKAVSPDKNVAVVFHSTGQGLGTEFEPGKEGEERFKHKRILLMDKESGKLAAEVKQTEQFNPFSEKIQENKPEILKIAGFDEKKQMKEIDKRIYNINDTQWDKTTTNLNFYKKEADEMMKGLDHPIVAKILDGEKNLTEREKEDKETWEIRAGRVSQFLHNNQLSFVSAFDNAYKYGSEKQKEALRKLSKELNEINSQAGKKEANALIHFSKVLDKGIAGLREITSGYDPATKESDQRKEDITNWGAPKQFVPVEEFAREKAAETFSNLALRSYTELGQGDASKAPVIAIENMNQMAYANPEDFKKLVEESRKKLTEKLQKEKNMSGKEAEKVADQLIGVTWDVGHLNMIKKHGFNDEDVIKASKEIEPYLKHVHLTDNFGYADSHLAPGMGNVPIKKILEELEKNGRLKDVVKIVEAPGFVQHFKKSPHGLTLAALGSPLYAQKAGAAGYHWNQVAALPGGGGYFGSPMAYLPEKHFSTYGSGFSSLPTEIGGQMPGTASRFSGTSNA